VALRDPQPNGRQRHHSRVASPINGHDAMPRKRTLHRMFASSQTRLILQHDPRKKRDRRKAASQKPDRMFGSSGCALGLFDFEVAGDSIEHGQLSLLDRCDGIVDGESSVFVQHLGVIRSKFNAQIVLPLGYFGL